MRSWLPWVEHFGDVDTARDELIANRHDVGDCKIKALRRTRSSRRDPRAKLYRGSGARGRELGDAKTVLEPEVGVKPPAQPPVKLLCAVDVRDGDYDDLELHVQFRDARAAGNIFFQLSHRIPFSNPLAMQTPQLIM